MEEQLQSLLNETFFGYSQSRLAKAQKEGRRFVHYTNAEAALSIIGNQEIWLRNSGVMNDYSEMAHGEACLRYCLTDHPETVTRTKAVLESIYPELYDQVVAYFYSSTNMRRAYTYLLSISEHGPVIVGPGMVDEESVYGRLSMWRAYGSGGGIALIFSQDALLNPNDVLPIFVSPVFYGNPDTFSIEFNRMLSAVERNVDVLKRLAPDIIFENFRSVIHHSSLACKHPGFAEEREWRITYSADPVNEHIDDDEFNATSKIKREFRVVNGIPQRIYKVPFVDYPDLTSDSIRLPAILKQVVVGPTQYPLVVLDALALAMRRCGFEDDKIHIAISNIPIRT